MKKLLFLNFTILCGFLSAQQISLTFGPDLPSGNKKTMDNLAYFDQSGYYFIASESLDENHGLYKRVFKERRLFIEKYGLDFKPIYSEEYKAKEDKTISYGIKYFKSKFDCLLSIKNKKEKTISFSIASFSMNGKVQNEKLLTKIKYNKEEEVDNIEWKLSNDTSKMLIIVSSKDNSKENKYKLNIFVLDTTNNIIWKKIISTPYSMKQAELSSAIILNNGNVNIVLNIRENLKDKNEKFYPYLFIVNSESESSLNGIKIKFDSLFLSECKISSNPFNNELLITSLYSKDIWEPKTGLVCLNVNPQNGDILNKSKKEYSNTLLDLLHYYSYSEKNGVKGLSAFISHFNTQFFKDSTMLVSFDGELFFGYEHISLDGIFTYIGNNGHIIDHYVLPKKQVHSEDDASIVSYSLSKFEDKLIVFYNENNKNMDYPILKAKEADISSNFWVAVPALVSIDKGGNYQRNKLFDTKELKLFLTPKYIYRISENKYITIGLKLKGKLNQNLNGGFNFILIELSK